MTKFNIFKKQSYYFLIAMLFFLNCLHSQVLVKKNLTDINKKNDGNHNQPVIITGVTDDPNAFKYLTWMNDAYLFSKNHQEVTKVIVGDSLYLRLDSIKESDIMSLIAFGDSGQYRQRLFVTPGDSITLIFKNKKLQITGKNKAHYDFFKELVNLNLVNVKYNGNLNQYKKECKNIFDKQNELLNQYINKNKKVSDDFIVKVKADLKFKYYAKLVFIYIKGESRGRTVSEIIAEGFHKDEEEIFDINSYFDSIKLEDFKRPELLSNGSFKQCLTSYISNYFVDNSLENFSSEKFLAEKKFILLNFEGELQHFAIARLIDSYNSFSASENVYNLKTLIKEYKHNFTKPSYIDKILEIERELKLVKSKLSEEVLNSKILNLKGDTLLLKDVLLTNKKSIKAIDFWASWCAPCISEIIEGHLIRNKMSENNNVEWIYFSIDEDQQKWMQKSNNLTKFGTTKNQYLLLNLKQSKLISFLGVTTIPRYVVIDENEIIIDGNAPRPSFESQFLKIINID